MYKFIPVLLSFFAVNTASANYEPTNVQKSYEPGVVACVILNDSGLGQSRREVSTANYGLYVGYVVAQKAEKVVIIDNKDGTADITLGDVSAKSVKVSEGIMAGFVLEKESFKIFCTR